MTFDPEELLTVRAAAPAPSLPTLAWLGEAADRATVLAELWATVELERALRDLGAPDGLEREAVNDPHLGARVVIVRGPDGAGSPADPGGTPPAIALAEPATEGRLAATLARRGEGPAGRYLGIPLGMSAIRAAATSAGVALSRPADGPFGPSVLVLGGHVVGPHLILVGGSAVPSRP